MLFIHTHPQYFKYVQRSAKKNIRGLLRDRKSYFFYERRCGVQKLMYPRPRSSERVNVITGIT